MQVFDIVARSGGFMPKEVEGQTSFGISGLVIILAFILIACERPCELIGYALVVAKRKWLLSIVYGY